MLKHLILINKTMLLDDDMIVYLKKKTIVFESLSLINVFTFNFEYKKSLVVLLRFSNRGK